MESLLDFQTVLFTALAIRSSSGVLPLGSSSSPSDPHRGATSLIFQSCLRFAKGHSSPFPSDFQSRTDEVKGFVLCVKSQRKGLYPS